MKTRTSLSFLLLLVLLPLLGGCANELKQRDWSKYDGPGREYFLEEEVHYTYLEDPIEPANRAVGTFNHILMVGIISPASWVYRGVFPKPVRNGIENAFKNLLWPVRFTSSLAQGKFNGAWNDTKRFVVNSTVGILGFRDQATKWHIPASPEDWGQTFGRWGWRNSSYVMLPVLGPSTVRDATGKIPDALTDPLYWYQPGGVPLNIVRSGTRAMNAAPSYKQFVATTYDPYNLGRRLYMLNRELNIDDYVYAAAPDASDGNEGEEDTLGAVFLGPKDPDFVNKREDSTVQVPGKPGDVVKELKYSLWRQKDKKSNLVYFLPGTGGHRIGGSSLAIAETIINNGQASVVTISSAFNFEFIAGALSSDYPGFAPSDAHDIHEALTAIDRQVRERYPDSFNDTIFLCGISLGGMHTLFIAASDADPANDHLLSFDGFLPLNSPVSLKHAVGKLDDFYNAPLAFPADVREEETYGILRKVAFLAKGKLEPDEPLPISKLEAEFLIGLSFRLTLGDIIYQTTLAHPRGILLTKRSKWKRTRAYQEIASYSFMEYFYAWALPYFAENRPDISFTNEGAERLFDLCDLRSIEGALKDNHKVLFVSNRNDFLLRPQDIEWAERTFAENSLFFERGGHIGNLFMTDIQTAISARFRQQVQSEEQLPALTP